MRRRSDDRCSRRWWAGRRSRERGCGQRSEPRGQRRELRGQKSEPRGSRERGWIRGHDHGAGVTPELARGPAMLRVVESNGFERDPSPPGPPDVATGATAAAAAERGTRDLGARLARLRVERQGSPAHATPAHGRPEPGAPREPAGGAAAAAAGPWMRKVDRASGLAGAIGGEVVHGPGGRLVRVVTSVDLPVPFDQLAGLPYPIDPGRPLVCLDTETTGLGTAAGTLAFLVGVGRWDGPRFEVEQLVLPDHPDEPALLAALRQAIPPDAWLVTYNGRGFDWPLLVTRFRLHRSPPPEHSGHLDLLPIARQLWRHRLEDARLATVERGVAGVVRVDDLPGALVPARYLEFLRTGEASPLRAVVDHNRQDVVSLGLLVAHLASRLAAAPARDHEPAGDVAALGRAYARRRRFDEAIACCEAAVGGATDPRQRERLASERARILRMAGRHEDSASAWQELAEARGGLAAVAWVQLAKHLEHVRRDPVAALDAADRALALLERQRALGRDLPRLEHDLVGRRARLRRRIASGSAGARAGRAARTRGTGPVRSREAAGGGSAAALSPPLASP